MPHRAGLKRAASKERLQTNWGISMLLKRLSYANVVASLALFIALGGVGYAATELPAKSVGTPQLKADAVTSGKVKNHTLLKADFKIGQIPAGARGANGPAGPAGAAGPIGPKGDAGAAGSAIAYGHISLAGLVEADSKGVTSANFSHPSVGVYCFFGLATQPKNVMTTASAEVGNNVAPGPVADFASASLALGYGCPAGVQFALIGLNNDLLHDTPMYFSVIG
jgi:hypothetical protein